MKLDLPELPAPKEKLLKKPTFFEKHSWTKPLLVITILVLLFDVLAYSALSSKKDQDGSGQENIQVTSGWKEYKDEKDAYLIKYPPQWSIHKEPFTNKEQDNGVIASALIPCKLPTDSSCKDPQKIYILISGSEKNLSAFDFAKMVAEQNPEAKTYKPVTISGAAGVRISDTSGKFPQESVYIKKGARTYNITWVKTKGASVETALFEGILGSFRLISEKEIIHPVKQTVCAMDMKKCPDGSWSGRTGEKCEFACPAK